MALLGKCQSCEDWQERYDTLFDKYDALVHTLATLRQQGFNPKTAMTVRAGAPPIEADALHRAEAPVGDAMIEGMVKEMVASGISEAAARLEATNIRRSIGSTFAQQP